MRSRHLSIVTHRDPAEVYEYACDPASLAAWAAGRVAVEGGAADEFEPGAAALQADLERLAVILESR